jgi:hypothetical protein
MPVEIPALLANAVVVSAPTTPFDVQSPLGGVTSALLTALAPVWPVVEPWLIVGTVVVVMGIATEIVVRELRRGGPPPGVGR